MRFSRLIFLACIAFAIVAPIKLFILEPIYIASASMEPTLKEGVHFFLDKFTYRFRKPERGEIISFRSPVGKPHDSIKRVIAVESDMVEMRDKSVFVNGEELYEPYVKHSRQDERLTGDTMVPLVVPDNHV
ncbi:MAG: signal peptidase I, partial [Deltaproteobacteria bacterium]|nr:signal peptidase I [Deltaproteobacteria bacterium]